MKRLLSLFISMTLLITALLPTSLIAAMATASTTYADDSAATTAAWGIYIYFCGSDLESGGDDPDAGGAATTDIAELLEIDLPEGVNVVFETGGAATWQNEVCDADYLERYLYNSEDFTCVDQVESASMGDADTFEDFLSFCTSNYPAEHEAVILWNHGGGSGGGVCYDELYDDDFLTLYELYAAFGEVCTLSEQDPPLEMVGFDACLMAGIDTASMLSDVAHYMVASEELEPGCGWNYTGIMKALAEDPQMDGEALGRAICDSYMDGCEEYESESAATLSLVDLTKISPLVDAYNLMGLEALIYSLSSSAYIPQFARGAERAENYGGNTTSSGYANMVDLGDLALTNAALLEDTAQTVIDSLDDCVLYKVNGEYETNSSGLSCYYSYNGDTDEFSSYKDNCVSLTFQAFYEYMLTGEIDADVRAELEEIVGDLDEIEVENDGGSESPGSSDASVSSDTTGSSGASGDLISQIQAGFGSSKEDLILQIQAGFGASVATIGDLKDEDFPVTVDDDGNSVLSLDQNTLNYMKDISFMLCYLDEQDDLMMYLGTDNNMEMDWDNGIFRDNFQGYWGGLDGHLCYMEIEYTCDEYTRYNIPIFLNDKPYQLKVVYDYEAGEYFILGARKGLEDNAKSDKNLRQLESGDKVCTILYGASISGDDELEQIAAEEFTLTDETVFEDIDMGDGDFVLMYQLTDARNDSRFSDAVYFEVENGAITTSVE